MRELGKFLFADNVFFFIIVSIVSVYFIVLAKLTSHSKIQAYLKDLLPIMVLIVVPGISIFPFANLSPESLADYDKTLISIAVQVVVYALALLLSRKFIVGFWDSIKVVVADVPLAALLFFTLLSCFWSETPLLTIRASLLMIGMTLLGIHIGYKNSTLKVFYYLRTSLACIAILSLPVSLFLPSVGLDYKGGWSGILQYANSLGAVMALSSVLWSIHYILRPRQRAISVLVAALSLLLVVGSTSGTGMLTFVSLSISILLIRWLYSVNARFLLPAIIITALTSLAMYILVAENLGSILDFAGKDLTLSGRTDIWSISIQVGRENWLLGHGFYGFWQPWRGAASPSANVIIPYYPSFVIPHAHNGFLQIFLDLGIIGLGLTFLSFISSFGKYVRRLVTNRNLEDIYFPVVLIYILLTSISQHTLFTPDHRWFYYSMIIGNLNRRIRIS
jgi:exopolysaccharide production protein ExoQ